MVKKKRIKPFLIILAVILSFTVFGFIECTPVRYKFHGDISDPAIEIKLIEIVDYLGDCKTL